MDKYEYKVIEMVCGALLETYLNEYAEEGWTFKSIVKTKDDYTIIMERKKQ